MINTFRPTCHYPNQWWPSLLAHIRITRPQWVKMNRQELKLWWRHQMETFSALLAICAGNSPVIGEFPTQRPVTRSFDVFFDLRLNKKLSIQWWDCLFKTPLRPSWLTVMVPHAKQEHYVFETSKLLDCISIVELWKMEVILVAFMKWTNRLNVHTNTLKKGVSGSNAMIVVFFFVSLFLCLIGLCIFACMFFLYQIFCGDGWQWNHCRVMIYQIWLIYQPGDTSYQQAYQVRHWQRITCGEFAVT